MRIALCSDTCHPIADVVSGHPVGFGAELERRGQKVMVYMVFSTDDRVCGFRSFRFPSYEEYRIGIPISRLYRDLEKFKEKFGEIDKLDIGKYYENSSSSGINYSVRAASDAPVPMY